MFIVYYSERQMNDLRRFIKNLQLDVSKLTSSELNEALMKSCTGDERFPKTSYPYLLSKKSREYLINELGLHLGEFDLEHFRLNSLHFLDKIVSCVQFDSAIQRECLSLLFTLATLDESPPIQSLVESNAIHALTEIVTASISFRFGCRSDFNISHDDYGNNFAGEIKQYGRRR